VLLLQFNLEREIIYLYSIQYRKYLCIWYQDNIWNLLKKPHKEPKIDMSVAYRINAGTVTDTESTNHDNSESITSGVYEIVL
jgi:hypothetical protein